MAQIGDRDLDIRLHKLLYPVAIIGMHKRIGLSWLDDDCNRWRPLPQYVWDRKEAMRLVETMRRRGWSFAMQVHGFSIRTWAEFRRQLDGENVIGTGMSRDTQEAIVLAAITALEKLQHATPAAPGEGE